MITVGARGAAGLAARPDIATNEIDATTSSAAVND
jgi:hypothetical protein